MRASLPETSPDAFVRRALTPYPKSTSALVVESSELDKATRELKNTLQKMNIPFVEGEINKNLRERHEVLRKQHPAAVVFASKSEDPELWRKFDRLRSRLETGTTTLFLLSQDAAESMSRNAPHLTSLLGPLCYYQRSSLNALIESAADACYPDLYEAVDHRPVKHLEQITDEILNAFGDPQTDDQAWWRFGHMGRALLIEVIPTISGHWPKGTAAVNAVLESLDRWLACSSVPSVPSNHIDGPRVPQALAEAIDVVINAARLFDRARARSAITEIVDDCLQGYAIFPGSAGRRNLFNWWLQVVVPAAWALQRPVRFNDTAL